MRKKGFQTREEMFSSNLHFERSGVGEKSTREKAESIYRFYGLEKSL